MNSNYNAGRAFEYKTKKAWEQAGYTVIRSAGSHGPADLVAFCPDCKVYLIQCKRVKTRADARKVIASVTRDRAFPPGDHWFRVVEVYISDRRETMTAYPDGGEAEIEEDDG